MDVAQRGVPMASNSAHLHRFVVRLCGIALLSVALPEILVTARAQERPANDDLCSFLSSERRVSFKYQESELFRRVIEQVQESPVTAPSAPRVVRTFAACLERFRERTRGEQPVPVEPKAESRSDPIRRVRFESSPDGVSFEVAYGQAPPRRYRTRDRLAALARSVTRDVIAQIAPSQKDEVRNQFWFLWFESYLRATGDRHNAYDYADDLAEEQAADRGRSFTVGFEVDALEGTLRVSDIQDEQLQQAGLTTGDEVVRIDERVVHEMSVPELQRYWLSPEPFEFTVTVRRDDRSFHVKGESVPTRHRTIAWSIRGESGYVRIREFSRGSLIELRRALRAMEAAGIVRLILDVRNNPGGTLSTGLVDMFFKPGETVVSYRDHAAEQAVDVDATVEYWGAPTAVLVDRDTASMGELLAAAFRTHERGPVVGERTHGKGVGQSLYAVLDEGRLHLVERTYYYPGTRETWNEVGIAPTREIELQDDERQRLQPYLDAQVLRLNEQWEADRILRAAEQLLREQP